MAIEITKSSILKLVPCPPLSVVPLTVFDRAAMDINVASLYAYKAPMPTNLELREGLMRVLARYPHSAGRVLRSADDGKAFGLRLDNTGVKFVEATVGANLADSLPLEAASTKISDLYPPTQGAEELLQVQINRYLCGGVVIGFTSHHHVADGQSMSQFLVAWANTVRDPNTAIPSPCHDRSSISLPRNLSPHCGLKLNHPEIELKQNYDSLTAAYSNSNDKPRSSITNFVVKFSAAFISKLKSKAPGQRSSTFECMLAHVWRAITVARGIKKSEFTQVRIAVNGRARMRDVPTGYYGNLVLWAYPRARAGELVSSSLAHRVGLIRDAINRVDEEYFKSFFDFGASLEEGRGTRAELGLAPATGSALCPNLEVDSLLRFNFHELDFGGGSPCSFLSPNLSVEGSMMFLPSCKEKGGVEVFLGLFREHVELFKAICYALE